MSEYRVSGGAPPGRLRSAILLDFVGSIVLAMLTFPFPIVRASVSVAWFVAAVIASIVLVHVLFLAATASTLGRTPGMYLVDLGFDEGRPALLVALRWATWTVLFFWPTLLGLPIARGLRASADSGLRVGSTR